MSVCTCIAQDRAHLTQVLPRWPIVHCPSDTGYSSDHHFEESPFRLVWPTAPVQLKTARTMTATWAVRVQLLDTVRAAQARLPNRGKKDWQPNDFSIFLSLFLLHIIPVPFPIHHQLTERIFVTYTFRVSLLCYYSSFTLIICYMVEVRGMCLRIAYAYSILYFEHSLVWPMVLYITHL